MTPDNPKANEAVAVIGTGFQLLYCRNDWSRGLSVGDRLYTVEQRGALGSPALVWLEVCEKSKDDTVSGAAKVLMRHWHGAYACSGEVEQ